MQKESLEKSLSWRTACTRTFSVCRTLSTCQEKEG